MRSAECGQELSVLSPQSSVVSRVFSGDPQGSAFQLRIATAERIPNSEFRTWTES